jgi:hypothetical protein
VRESLVVPFVRNDSKEDAALLGVPAPFYLVEYDFVLEPDSDAPKPTMV